MLPEDTTQICDPDEGVHISAGLLEGSKVLANRPCTGFGATREACERVGGPASLGSDLWACE